MRIGIFSQWYEPEPTLIPSVLARELSQRHHKVRVLTGFPNYPQGKLYAGYRLAPHTDEDQSGVAVRRVALYPSHDSSRVGRLTNYTSFAISAAIWGSSWFRGVDSLWVANSPPTVGLPTWLFRIANRPRVILHILDLWPESLVASEFAGSFLSWPGVVGAIDRWLSMTYQTADSIACISRKQIEVLASRGVPREKLSYVPVWVDESIFHPAERNESLARELNVVGKRVLLYAGALGEAQGLTTLLEVCDRLRDEPSLHCLIAGSGVAEPKLRAEAESRKLGNVTFLGPWPAGDMNRLMSVGDVHFISLRSDSISEIAMPSKLPATLACGKPLIVAARGDVADVVARAGAGWVCPPGDANELETAVRASLAASDCDLNQLGRLSRDAYEAEFAASIGVDRIERLLMGAP